MSKWLLIWMLMMLPAAYSLAGDAVPVQSITLNADSSWTLDVKKDGSGQIGYGSNVGDAAAFDKGTILPSMLIEQLKDKLLEKQEPKNCANLVIVFENGSKKYYFISDKECVSDIMLTATKNAKWLPGRKIMEFIKEHPYVGDRNSP